jgi:hypothetical protein
MRALRCLQFVVLWAAASSQVSLASDTSQGWEIGLSLAQREYAVQDYRVARSGLPAFPGALGAFYGSMGFREADADGAQAEEAKFKAAREFGLEYRFKGVAAGPLPMRPRSGLEIGRMIYKDHARRPFRGHNFLGFDLGVSFGSKPVDIYIDLGYRMSFVPKTDEISYLGIKSLEQSMVYPKIGFDFVF